MRRKNTNPVHLPRWLRMGGQRPREEAEGEARDECSTADHSMT
jgi:hypothetical protein